MDRYERINALHRILKAARYPVTVPRLQEELGCSRATVYRDLAFLRDALMAPVEGDGEAGFRYDPQEGYVTGGEGAAVASAPAQPFAAPQTPMRYHGAGHLYRPDFYNSPYNRDARQRYSGPGYFGSCSRYDGCKEVQVVPLWPYGRGN